MVSMKRKGSARRAADTRKGVRRIQFRVPGLTSDREHAGDTRTHWAGCIVQQQGQKAM